MIKTKVRFFECSGFSLDKSINDWVEQENVCITNIIPFPSVTSSYAIRVLVQYIPISKRELLIEKKKADDNRQT